MTYEPTAFADQIVVIWLPFLLGASITDFSVFKWRWKWVTLEKFLLFWTMWILAFTLSRTGLIIGVGLILFGILLKLFDFIAVRRDIQGLSLREKIGGIIKNLRPRYALLILLGVAIFLISFYFLGSRSGYISRIWEYWDSAGDKDLRTYLRYIGFGSRIAYWQTAYHIYLEHPLFGVGLGNFTIYLPEFLPFQHLALTPELLRHLVPRQNGSRVQTAKHFLLRILAETGLVGMGIFITFLLVLLAAGLYLWLSDDEGEHFWGTVSVLGVVAFVVDSFSFDSFAIPNPWIMFGMITAAYRIFSGGKEEGGD
jgi:O-antigen ligase